jgi:hypothetical protein
MRERSTVDTDEVARLVGRVAERLGHLPPSRLAPVEDDVRAALVELAALALAAQGEPARSLPSVASRAWGDQLSVLGHDLVEGLHRRPDPVLARRAHAVLVRLRRALP